MEDLYAIKNKNDKFIAVDQSSGGYPYEAHTFKDVELWTNIEAASSYMRACRDFAERDKWYIVKVIIDEQVVATPLLEYTAIVSITHYAESRDDSVNKLSPLLSQLISRGQITGYKFIDPVGQ